jgi:hypothetical protein
MPRGTRAAVKQQGTHEKMAGREAAATRSRFRTRSPMELGSRSRTATRPRTRPFDLRGFLGLQLRSGEPMTVQFKDIFLKPL